MSTTAYYESDRGSCPPAPTPLRQPLSTNTGQALASTADLLDRRRRCLDPGLRRTFGVGYVNAPLAEIDAALAARGRAA